MKNHIICHYKNGSLLFCTTEVFQLTAAHEILNIFNDQGLTTLLEQKTKNVFHVVGRMYVDYDPFVNGSNKWGELLSQMSCTKKVLEDKLKPFFNEPIKSDNAGFII